ncbi:hypothetical protein B0H10DRAFT_2004096 [Mycena sp. CBHHK59/15]|nr:hypothetical protein B0H10DRAFT_2004096 [Mycena sp. CBHHK59/15]
MYDPGDTILRCFKHCTFSSEWKVVTPTTLDEMATFLSRMHSLESFKIQYTKMVPFSTFAKALAGLPLLRRVDIWHCPWSEIPCYSEFPGNICHFSFSPRPVVVSPEEVRPRKVFDPPDDAEVVTVSTALHATLQRCYATLETLDIPMWCFPLEQLRGALWNRLRVLNLRGYLRADGRHVSEILHLFPSLESLEIEVVRTDPSLIEDPQYLWGNSERERFPAQLKHLSLIDVCSLDPIFHHLPTNLTSLSIIDTRFRKYGRDFEVPIYDADYRTWLTQPEIGSIVARSPQTFAALTYFRISISSGRQTNHWYVVDETQRFYYVDIPLNLVRTIVAACPLLERLDLHFQRERFLLPPSEEFADALSPVRSTLETLCIEQPDWGAMPLYPASDILLLDKANQKIWFDFLDAWLKSLRQHMPALRRGSFGFEVPWQSERWQSFIMRIPAGRCLDDSTPKGFTRWHIFELTDYDKRSLDGKEDLYFYSEHYFNPLLRRYRNKHIS